MDLAIQKIPNTFFLHNVQGDVDEFITKCNQCQKEAQEKFKEYQVNFISSPLNLK